MSSRLTLSVLSLSALGLAISCKSEPPAPPPPPPQPAQPAAAEEPPAPESNPACVGPIASGTPTSVSIGAVTWELNGSTLTWKSPAATKLVIGAVSDIKEASEENKANLKQLADWFTKQKVDLIVVSGDTGEKAEEIEAAVDILAGVKVPLFTIVGNRETWAQYQKALTAAKARHPHVFDLNQVRRVDTAVADIVSMPGYFNISYIHPEEPAVNGCPYYAADVAKTAALVKTCDSPVVLVSHGGPKQQGANGVDRTAEGANVGDPALTKLIEENKIPFGIFGNIHEAGGHGTDLAGTTNLPQKTPQDALYLNPGPADAVMWPMNDGTTSLGMGAIVTIKDGKASYVIQRLKGASPSAKAKGK